MANLSPEQLALVEQWAADGATLNDVQNRLKADFGITLTYLDARLLMLEVGVKIKDKPREVPKVEEPSPSPAPAAAEPEPEPEPSAEDWGAEPAASPAKGSLTVTLDQIAIPGTLVSGKVTFSDGVLASWYIDQMNRLGLDGVPEAYNPPAADVPLFQQQLRRILG